MMEFPIHKAAEEQRVQKIKINSSSVDKLSGNYYILLLIIFTVNNTLLTVIKDLMTINLREALLKA